MFPNIVKVGLVERGIAEGSNMFDRKRRDRIGKTSIL